MPKVLKNKKSDPLSEPAAPAAAAMPAELSPKAAEESFEAFRPRLLALDSKRLAAMSVELDRASVAIAAVGRWVKEKGPRARFAALPEAYFAQAHVDELEGVAMAAWHAGTSLRSASAGKTEAKLPVSLVQEATTLKQRMLDLLQYHFGTDPVDGPEIDDIKVGTGYTDLAGDLVRLARLYAKRRDQVKLDPKNYRPADEADAGRIAHAIFRELGEAKNQDQKAWTDLVQRAFTLLVTVYGEVSAAGSWLWRHEDAATRFPSLYVVGRPPPRAAARPQGAEAKEPGIPAAQAAGDGSAGEAKSSGDDEEQ